MHLDAGIVAERTMAARGEDVPIDTGTTGTSVSAALDEVNRRLQGPGVDHATGVSRPGQR